VDGRSRPSARLLRVIRDLLTAHPSIAVYPDKRTIPSRTPRPILGDFGFASSDAECALVGEKRRRAAGVQEDDILVFAPTPLADQGDQAREPLA
jgi:hypothetical protein